MSPIVFLVVGLLLIWLVFTGRATNVWSALTGGLPTPQPATPPVQNTGV